MLNREVDIYIDRAATLFCPCTKDYIFAPIDDDLPCF